MPPPTALDVSVECEACPFNIVPTTSTTATLALGDFKGAAGTAAHLPGAGKSERVILLGCGERDKFDRDTARKVVSGLYTALNRTSARDACLHLGELAGEEVAAEWLLELVGRQLTVSAYRYKETLSKPKPEWSVRKLVVNPGEALPARKAGALLEQGCATGNGVNLARNLANLPGNICTPDYLASEARKLARKHDKLSAKALSEKQMAELGMGSLLSVTAGTAQPARLIIMEYKGGRKSDQPYVLVGKGITFDSGGISIKPGAKMDEMKFDMGGAASVKPSRC